MIIVFDRESSATYLLSSNNRSPISSRISFSIASGLGSVDGSVCSLADCGTIGVHSSSIPINTLSVPERSGCTLKRSCSGIYPSSSLWGWLRCHGSQAGWLHGLHNPVSTGSLGKLTHLWNPYKILFCMPAIHALPQHHLYNLYLYYQKHTPCPIHAKENVISAYNTTWNTAEIQHNGIGYLLWWLILHKATIPNISSSFSQVIIERIYWRNYSKSK